MTHKYIARTFYTDKMIADVFNKNTILNFEEDTDPSKIDFSKLEDSGSYSSIYEEQVLKRDEDNDLYKIINLKVGSADAYLVAIYDPTKVQLISKEKLGTDMGERTITMCQRYGGVVCINGRHIPATLLTSPRRKERPRGS